MAAPTGLQFYKDTKYDVTVVSTDGQNMSTWWKTVQTMDPFKGNFLADPIHSNMRHQIRLHLNRIVVGQQITIDILEKAGFQIKENPNKYVPRFTYISDTIARVTCDSEAQLYNWWMVMKNSPPFDMFVNDRVQYDPCSWDLRLGSGHINKTIQVLKNAGFVIFNEPVKSIEKVEYSKEEVLNKTYSIAGKDYVINGLFNQNGMYGDIYLALDPQTSCKVVIKVLRNPSDREHIELQKMQNRGGHVNIVSFYGSATFLGRTFIAMEYIEGQTQEAFTKTKQWTQEHEQQYQAGLLFMRTSGVQVSRENDRENVMITKEGRVVLIDFGTLAQQ